MLREATNAGFVEQRVLFWRRFVFRAGRVDCARGLSVRGHARLAERQALTPVAVAEQGRRRWWWFHDRFWWEDDGLRAEDVMALVLDRERRARRRLERAHAVMRAEREPPARAPIPLVVKRTVWERCGGRCVECGAEQGLEFDHVIPLSLGGSSSERNLQLLCAECNRAKGDAL
jgi:5-methylcytosine-specific restriction endonuclease McrA